MAEHSLCYCGNCKSCIATVAHQDRMRQQYGCSCIHGNCDCARWEQIYREKFEDPNYYERGAPTAQSSLACVPTGDEEASVDKRGNPGPQPGRMRAPYRKRPRDINAVLAAAVASAVEVNT